MLLSWMEATESVCWILSSCLVDNASFFIYIHCEYGFKGAIHHRIIIFFTKKKEEKKKKHKLCPEL